MLEGPQGRAVEMTNDERDEMLRATHDTVIRLETAGNMYRETVDDMVVTVKGNGQTGLTSRVRQLEMVAYRIMGPVLLMFLAAVAAWAFTKV